MGRFYTLWQVQKNINQLRNAVAKERLGEKDIDLQFFTDFGITKQQAHVIGWLLNHNNEEHSLNKICCDLRVERKTLLLSLDLLLNKSYIVCYIGDDLKIKVDVPDSLEFSLIDIQAMRECRRLEQEG